MALEAFCRVLGSRVYAVTDDADGTILSWRCENRSSATIEFSVTHRASGRSETHSWAPLAGREPDARDSRAVADARLGAVQKRATPEDSPRAEPQLRVKTLAFEVRTV